MESSAMNKKMTDQETYNMLVANKLTANSSSDLMDANEWKAKRMSMLNKTGRSWSC